MKTPIEQTNEHCGQIRDIQELYWMFSLPPSAKVGAPGLRVSVNWTCSQQLEPKDSECPHPPAFNLVNPLSFPDAPRF